MTRHFHTTRHSHRYIFLGFYLTSQKKKKKKTISSISIDQRDMQIIQCAYGVGGFDRMAKKSEGRKLDLGHVLIVSFAIYLLVCVFLLLLK